jgi:hypothetical protein
MTKYIRLCRELKSRRLDTKESRYIGYRYENCSPLT